MISSMADLLTPLCSASWLSNQSASSLRAKLVLCLLFMLKDVPVTSGNWQEVVIGGKMATQIVEFPRAAIPQRVKAEAPRPVLARTKLVHLTPDELLSVLKVARQRCSPIG